MDVLVVLESLQHRCITADVGNQTQFDLGVIRRQKGMLIITRDESAAHFGTFGGAHRNVLQVGVIRTQTARGSQCLIERGMDAARAGIDHFGQRVYVSRLEFGQPPEVQDGLNDREFRRQLQ